MKRFKFEIKNGKATRVSTTKGLTEIEAGMIAGHIDRALQLSGFKGNAEVVKGERDTATGEDEGAAITKWSLSSLFQKAQVTLFTAAFVLDAGIGVPLGATMTHEFIHCKQGLANSSRESTEI